MAVVKSKRTLSDMEFHRTAFKLRIQLTELAFKGFGKRVTTQVPDWWLDSRRKTIDAICISLAEAIRAGNSIYPSNARDLTARRMYQTQAIIHVEQLVEELQYIAEVLNKLGGVDVSQIISVFDTLTTEIKLLKGWRKANGKLKKG